MTYDAQSLLTGTEERADGRDGYVAQWSQVVPVTAARIQEVLESREMPEELVDHNAAFEIDPRAGARQYVAEARHVPAEAWQLANVPVGEVPAGQLAARAVALNEIRRWFTRALHMQVGGSIAVHWLNEPDYRQVP